MVGHNEKKMETKELKSYSKDDDSDVKTFRGQM